MWKGPVEWLQRARRLIPKEDRRVLVSPPRLIARFMRFTLHHALGRAAPVADDVDAIDPAYVELFMDACQGLGRPYFRLRVEGVENVPATGAALLVGNHSGGLVPLEGFFVGMSLWERFGLARRMYALVHDFLFDDEILRRYALRIGMLRASGDSARHALERGHLVLVYPGGDWESFRPFSERFHVDLDRRKGFIRLALRQRVPIVPIVTAGSHEQFIVLTRGERLARLVGLHRFARTDVLPIVIAVPWGVTVGFVPYLPLPTQMTIAFGEPMSWPELGPEAADDPAVVDRIYDELVARMQAKMDQLADGRHFLLGRRGASSTAIRVPAAPTVTQIDMAP